MLHDDPLDDLFNNGAAPAPARTVTPPASYTEPTYFQPCRKCAGTGMTRWGKCFACKGKRGKAYKTAPEVRQKQRAQAQARTEQKAKTALESFAAEHPAIAAWFDGSTFPFAVAMREAVEKYGDLTERQLAASYAAIEKLEAAKKAAADRKAAAPVVDISAMTAAFQKKLADGKRAKLMMARIEDRETAIYNFSPAKPDSKNPGAIYVRRDNAYMGKIVGDKFHRVRECTPEIESAIVAMAADPKGAAIATGRLLGSCSCCGRTLTDQVSIDMGIGPICAGKYGW